MFVPLHHDYQPIVLVEDQAEHVRIVANSSACSENGSVYVRAVDWVSPPRPSRRSRRLRSEGCQEDIGSTNRLLSSESTWFSLASSTLGAPATAWQPDMAFPAPTEELALHERLLAGDPVVSADVFQALMDPVCHALQHDLHCSEDEAYDSGVDAVYAYLDDPSTFDRNRGRLSTYVMDIAKKRAIDRIRSRTAGERRDDAYAKVVELRARNPKDVMETEIMARELWPRVEEAVASERDRKFLKLICEGERSTVIFAELLGLSGLPADEQRLTVKQHRDRLMKVLERLGAKLRNDAEN